jgi:pyruvate/2-oxoglutarate dehydrogenase complex dihydrolipoamide dehydrogenase (E3) component
MHRRILIIGNGPAAWGILSGLSSCDASIRPTVVAPDWPAPSVPGLSQVALGHVPIHRADWKAQRQWPAETLHGAVECVDAEARQVHWRDGLGQKVICTYEFLAAATGTAPRTLEIPSAFRGRILHFHRQADLAGWMALQPGERVAVVGGGLVGAEMVEMAVHKGCEVHWLLREGQIWPNILSHAASSILAREAEAHGVHMHFNVADGLGHAVQLGAEVIGLAIGAAPHLPPGFPTDNRPRGMYIAGDACGGPTGWATAMAHGKEVGRAMAAQVTAPPPSAAGIPFRASFFHQKVLAIGEVVDTDGAVWQSEFKGRICTIATNAAGRAVGVASVGVGLDVDQIFHMLSDNVDPETLINSWPNLMNQAGYGIIQNGLNSNWSKTWI